MENSKRLRIVKAELRALLFGDTAISNHPIEY